MAIKPVGIRPPLYRKYIVTIDPFEFPSESSEFKLVEILDSSHSIVETTRGIKALRKIPGVLEAEVYSKKKVEELCLQSNKIVVESIPQEPKVQPETPYNTTWERIKNLFKR